MENKYSLCFVSSLNKQEAETIAQKIIEEKLSAYISILPSWSFYRNENKIEKIENFILLIRSKNNLKCDIIQTIKNHHSQKEPEILFIDIDNANIEYLNWLGANTLFTSNISKDIDKGLK